MTPSAVGFALSASASAICALVPLSAKAQSQPIPPEHYTLDPRGVDLVNLDFTLSTTDVVIGQPGQGGLVYGRTYLSSGEGWRDSNAGTFSQSGSDLIVSFGPVSERFVHDGTNWVSAENNGSTFGFDTAGNAVVTNAAGVQVVFSYDYYDMITAYGTQTPIVTEVRFPDGEVLTYHNLAKCDTGQTYPCLTFGYIAARLQSITSNRGYQLKFVYQSDAVTNTQAWLRTKQVIGINNAVDYCDPIADACSSLSRTWPSMTYSNQVNPLTATDQMNRTVTYAYGGPGGRLTSIRLPGSTSDDVAVTYDTSGYVTQVVGASGTWTYEFSDIGTTRTTVTEGPLSQGRMVTADLTIGRAVKVTDLTFSNEWEYTYTDGNLTEVEAPEGNRTEYQYDGRGNVTRIRAYNKAGTDFIETSATYASSCTANVACNSPLTATDAMGRVTDYDWDEDHGGLLSVTLPAPATGQPRPQTRITYEERFAWYKDSTGTIVEADDPIILPIETSACATAAVPTPGCAGTADEIQSVTTYGSTGVANNLLPSQIARGSGSSPNMAVTAMTYTPTGDVETIDGPLSGAGDLTQYRYDDGRQLVGVVGPDPDSTGPRLNRAQRMTYNSRGQVTLAEQGTTPGYSNTDWSNFAALQKVAQSYDSWARPIRSEVQAANGTIYGLSQVSYDAAGRPECQVVRMNPAVFGSVTTNACALGTQAGYGPDRIVRTTYDALGRPLSTTSGYGVTGEAITESVTYTANGLPQSLTDGAGNVSILEYDGWDRASKLRYPNATGGGTSTTDFDAWTYDDAGNVLTQNRRGVSLSYDWDDLGRLVEVVAPSVATRSYEYDNLGRMTEAASAGSLVQTFVWDALGRQTRELSSGGGWVTSDYDAAGRRTRLTWPDYWYVDYDFDFYGGLLKVRQQGATSGAGVLATYAYDDLGRRTSATLGNGATASWGWDPISRLSSIGFDPAGTGDDLTITYAHDPAGSIVQRTLSDADYAFAPATGSTTYANDGLNRVTSVAGSSVTYDGAQNATIVPGGPTLTFDGLNQMTGSTINSVTTPLGYDSLGRLRQTGASTTKVSYVYDGVQLIQENDNTGAISARHVPGAGLDATVASVDGAGVRTWLMADERGSTMALVNPSAAVTQVNAWDEYGVPRPGNAGRFQYTGQVWLGFAELQNSRARTYDPGVGRFRQTDPTGYADGSNVYAYVRANPISFSDPLGTECWTMQTWTDTYRGVLDSSGRLVGWKLQGSVLKSERVVCDTETQYDMFTIFAANPDGLLGVAGAICPAPRPQGIGMQVGGFGQGLGDAFTFGGYSELWAAFPGEYGDMYQAQTETAGYRNGLYLATGVSAYRLLYAGSAATLSTLTGRNAVSARNGLKGLFSGTGPFHPRMRSYEQMLAKYGTDRGVALAASRTNPTLTGSAIVGSASGGSQALGCL